MKENTLFGLSFTEISRIASAVKMCKYGLICGDADFVLQKELNTVQEFVTKHTLTKKPMSEREFFMKLIGYGVFKLRELEEIDEVIKRECKRVNCFDLKVEVRNENDKI